MAIIKTLACAVLFLVQVTNADFYVNCMAAPYATPDDGCTTDVLKEVLDLLKGCTELDMDYVKLARRRLGSGGEQQAGESKRELQDPDNGCYETNLSGGARMMCCMQTGDKYSYCGSPTSDRRELQEAGYYTEAELAAIAAKCTNNFKVLANEAEDACFGSAEDVFCETIQIVIG
jgi:hypothetical protein